MAINNTGFDGPPKMKSDSPLLDTSAPPYSYTDLLESYGPAARQAGPISYGYPYASRIKEDYSKDQVEDDGEDRTSSPFPPANAPYTRASDLNETPKSVEFPSCSAAATSKQRYEKSRPVQLNSSGKSTPYRPELRTQVGSDDVMNILRSEVDSLVSEFKGQFSAADIEAALKQIYDEEYESGSYFSPGSGGVLSKFSPSQQSRLRSVVKACQRKVSKER